MYANNEQFTAAGKAGLESIISVTNTGLVGLEKLFELNVASAKALFSDVTETTRAALGAKDAKELIAQGTSFAQPALEKSIAYSKEVYGIVTTTQAALRAAAEEQSANVQREFTSILDKSLKSAPPGSESAVAALRTAVAAATSAFDNAAKIAKQSFETAESNFKSAATSVAANVATVTKVASKRK